MVPPTLERGTPVLSAIDTYIASRMAAGELIVIDVDTEPTSMPSNRSSMSASVSTATPARPTSPKLISSSESRPISVGMSNAVDNPVPPERRISLNRPLVSSAVPNPANCRIVHNLERYIDAYGPRVYGNCPGNSPPSGPYTADNGTPDIVSKSASRNPERRYAPSHSAREPMSDTSPRRARPQTGTAQRSATLSSCLPRLAPSNRR